MVGKRLEIIAAELSQAGVSLADEVNENSGSYVYEWQVNDHIDLLLAEFFRVGAQITIFLKQSQLRQKEREKFGEENADNEWA